MHGIVVTIKWAKSCTVDYRLMARKQRKINPVLLLLLYMSLPRTVYKWQYDA